MNTQQTSASVGSTALSNGSGAAAIVAASIGAFALSVLAIAADKIPSIQRPMTFYKPTGPLSGVTTVAILVWLLTWVILEWRWRNRTIAIGRSNAIALVLLGLSLLLTFPPFVDLF